MLTVDLRGLTGKEPFEKLRDTMKPYCGRQLDAELLVDEEGDLSRIRQFVAMSGCSSEVRNIEGHWIIRISGDACQCR